MPVHAPPRVLRVFVAAITFAGGALASAAHAQDAPFFPLPPNVRYDASIPTPRAVLGHDPAQVVTPPEELVRYMHALAAAAPERTRMVEYARSWEGRPLVMMAIGSAERMARADDIRAGLARLADPRTLSPADEVRLIAELPVVTALLHSVHGNEISPAGSSLATAYHLLAARGDAAVDRIMRESIVLIDPTQNPDGRARFVFTNGLGAAARPDPDPLSAEHDEPWPGGRSNHYLFDLNRDWFAHTQPESRGKVRALLEWNPQVVVDLHEMGGNSTYYFPPSAVPGNPHATAQQKQLFELFGRENARMFDERGWAYFISEIFDSFYPGYGASWPTTHGALGKTFEMASSRGLVLERYDGSHLTYGDGVERNFHAALRTALTAAENRERLLREFVAFRRSAVSDGQRGTRAWVLDAAHDGPRVIRLARTLAANGIEVRRARSAFRVAGRDFAAGSLIVPLDQPAGRLVRNLLDPQTDMDAAFVQRQRERRAQRLNDEIYDITAWSMPLLWGIAAVAVDRPVDVASDIVAAEPFAPWPTPPHITLNGSSASAPWLGAAPVQAAALPGARVGYVMPWGTATAAAVAEALAAGIPVHAAGAAFGIDGRSYGAGTAFVRASDLDAAQRDQLAQIVARAGAEAVPLQSAFVDEGISLGSNQMRVLKAPRVMLLWDAPTASLSAGATRWVLERRYGQHATAVRAGSFGRADLGRYDVVVMPSGNYADSFGDADVQRLRRWVQDGGTLITLAEATVWAARENVGLLATRAETRQRAAARDGAQRAAGAQPIDLLEAITPEREMPEPISGAIIRVALDGNHVLAAGSGTEVGAMVSGSRVFSPLTLDRGTNIGVYAPVDRLVMSGIVWDEARPQLASKAFLMRQSLGRGRIIAFAEDPNFRGYAEATQLLFMNAVLLGPAF
ncbi:M14 family zinc carboxypeptidase [soil metagenome]